MLRNPITLFAVLVAVFAVWAHFLPSAVGFQPAGDPTLLACWRVEDQPGPGPMLPNAVGGPPALFVDNPARLDKPTPCLRLDGDQDALLVSPDIAKQRPPLPQRDMTVAAWVSLNAPLEAGGIAGVFQDNGGEEKGWLLGFDQHVFYFALASVGRDDGDGLLSYLMGQTRYEPGRWYHVAATYDGQTMRLFVNGRLEAESTEQSGDILYPEHAPFALGAFWDRNEFFPLDGRLKEVSLWNTARPAEQIAADFAVRAGLAESPPWYPPLRLRVGPYLQYVTQTGITVMWETTTWADSMVRYGRELPLTRVARDETPALIHEVRLEGLEPDSPYFYQVVSKSPDGQRIESPVLTFQTAVREGRPFAFTVFGDTRDNPDTLRTLAQLCYAQRPHFTLIVGDLVGRGSRKHTWLHDFFPSVQPLIGRVALFPVIGNHEEDAGWYYRYMSAPAPEYRYDFRYGNAHFFVIDTDRPVGPDSEQYHWLDARLAQSDATWKFVLHHHPPYSSDSDDYGDTKRGESRWGDPQVRQLVPLYEKHGVDIVWAGHIHAYERSWPLKNGKAVEDGGVLYITTGGGGAPLEQFAPTRAWFANKLALKFHIGYVTINGRTLEYQAIDDQGRVFDAFTLTKPPAP